MPTEVQSPDEQKPVAFTCAMPMRWADMDALDHMNNALYFRFFEEARIKLLDRVGGVRGAGRMSILAHTSCDFLRPVVYPATVVVSQVINRVGNSSLDVSLELTCEGSPDVVHAKGRYVVVSASIETGRPVAWTPDQRRVFEALQAGS